MNSISEIRVVIVEDHPRVRAGIIKLLNNARDIVIVGEGENGLQAIQLAGSVKPDLLLLDVELPYLRGDEVLRRIRNAQQGVKVLAVSSYNDRFFVDNMMENGAMGYITKDEAPEMLIDAVRAIVTENRQWISPQAGG